MYFVTTYASESRYRAVGNRTRHHTSKHATQVSSWFRTGVFWSLSAAAKHVQHLKASIHSLERRSKTEETKGGGTAANATANGTDVDKLT